MNILADQVELVTGLPGIAPRFPQPERKIIQTRDVVFNNIHVSNSSIGILNTGNLEIVDSAITALKQDPKTQEFGIAIERLANAIAEANDLTQEKKNEAMEILGVIASKATAPKEKRRSGVVRSILATLPNIIQTSAAIIQIWQEIEPIIKSFFQ